MAIYKDGPHFETIVFDAAGRRRPEWAAAFDRRSLRARRMDDQMVQSRDWAGLVRRIGAGLDRLRRPYALATIVVRPPR